MEDEQTKYNLVTIINIDQEPLYYAYNKKNYVLQPGKRYTMARFLAVHATKHLIDQILNRENKSTRDEASRADLAAKIVLHEETYSQPEVVTGEDLALKQADEMAKPSDLDTALLNKPATNLLAEAKAAQSPAFPPSVQPTTPENEEFAGLKETSSQAPSAPVVSPSPVEPTREDIRNYVQNTLKVDLASEKGIELDAKINTLPIQELIDGVSYPVAE